MWTGWTRETIMAIIALQKIFTIYNAVQYFFGVWVVKYSKGGAPPWAHKQMHITLEGATD